MDKPKGMEFSKMKRWIFPSIHRCGIAFYFLYIFHGRNSWRNVCFEDLNGEFVQQFRMLESLFPGYE